MRILIYIYIYIYIYRNPRRSSRIFEIPVAQDTVMIIAGCDCIAPTCGLRCEGRAPLDFIDKISHLSMLVRERQISSNHKI